MDRAPLAGSLQLTYASLGSAGGSGGWQVRQADSELTADERAVLVGGASTSVEPVVPIPQFPTSKDVAELPRRLCYQQLGDACAFWNSTPAGPDASGRLGNVFTHAVLRRGRSASGLPGGLRPIELYGALAWLTPFGADAVAESTFDSGMVPGPSGTFTRERVVSFLLEEGPSRMGTVATLLDAVASRCSGGQPIFLAAPSVDEGAMWLAIASFFLAPATCAALSFSTFDRARVALQRSESLDLTVIPQEDLVVLRRESALSAVVVDPLGQVELVDTAAGPCWKTDFGQEVPVTDLSRLAVDACGVGASLLEQCLSRIDAVAASTPRREGDGIAWSLAMAMAYFDGLRLSWPAATKVLLRETPPHVELDSETSERLITVIEASSGRTAAEAWALLSSAVPGTSRGPTPLRDVLLTAYVSRALHDQEWLCAPAPAPIVTIDALGSAAAAELGALSAAAVRNELSLGFQSLSVEQTEEIAFRRYRLLDFLARLERYVGAGDLDLSTDLIRLAEGIGDYLLGPSSAAIVVRVGQLDSETIAKYVAPSCDVALSRDTRPPGQRLHASVAEWLRAGFGDRRLIAAAAAGDPDPVVAELLVVSARDAGAPSALKVPAARTLLLWLTAKGSLTEGTGRGVLDQCGAGDLWTVDELDALLSGLPVAAALALSTAACQALRASAPGPAARRLGQLIAGILIVSRSGQRSWWVQPLCEFFAALDDRWYAEPTALATAQRIVRNAELAWAALSDDARSAVAAHVLLAAILVRSAELTRRIPENPAPTTQLLLAIVQLGVTDVPPMALEVDPGQKLADELSIGAARSWRIPLSQSGGHTAEHFLLFRLPSESVDTMGAPDLASAVLRSLLVNHEAAAVRKYGEALSRREIPEQEHDEFRRWWDNVVPTEKGNTLTRALRPGRNRRGGER